MMIMTINHDNMEKGGVEGQRALSHQMEYILLFTERFKL